MFRFTIRAVLWLTVVVGVITVWWLDRAALRGQLGEAARVLNEEREVAEDLGLENSRLHKLEDRLSHVEAKQLLNPPEESQGFPGG